jgi:beta-mannosidase
MPEDTLLFWSFTASNGMTGEGHHVSVNLQGARPRTFRPDARRVAACGRRPVCRHVGNQGLALHVMIEADVAGRWSDNAFDLTAGEQKTVIFTPTTSGAVPQFHWLDLHSCQTHQA